MPPSPGDPLSVWAEALYEATRHQRHQEAELRHDLYLVLAPYLRDEVGLPDSAIQHERTTLAGRYDSLFGRALIEYKRPGLLATATERRKAAKQALDYLSDAEVGAEVVLITDGATWAILRDPTGAETTGVQLALDLGLDTQVPPIDRFQWRPSSPETAERILGLLASVRATPVTSRTIVATLGLGRTEPNALLARLSKSLGERAADSRADMLFRQWLELAGVAYGIRTVEEPWPRPGRERILGSQLVETLDGASYAESIFALHTFIALACKMIAAELLAQLSNDLEHRPSQWASLDNASLARAFEAMEEGRLVDEMGAPGLFAGDLFGWYAPMAAEDSSVLAALRGFTMAFSELAWAKLANSGGTAGDLLRDFYTATLPRPLRKALGEFFTPQWLAERVFSQAMRKAAGSNVSVNRILDPACGSGTFVVTAFNFLLQRSRATGGSLEQRVRQTIDAVIGFDINPISTLMTRVNLLLNLGPDAEVLPEVAFHVYQADSILLPEQLAGAITFEQQSHAVRLPLVIGDLFLPTELSTLDGVHALVRVIEASLQSGRSREVFVARLRAELEAMGLAQASIRAAEPLAVEAYERLEELHRAGRDGIWGRVIEQAFAPGLIGPVDLVVGNPPWVSWKNTPQGWQDRSESLWRSYGLWQRRRSGGGIPLADVSTLLFARSLATYAPNGLVALLLPQSVLKADPGSRAIRACRLSTAHEDLEGAGGVVALPFAPIHVDDFSTLNPFPDAATTPIALYATPGKGPSFPIEATAWTRSRPGVRLPADIPWFDARARLTPQDFGLVPLHSADPQSIWVSAPRDGSLLPLPPNSPPAYSWGQGFHTRGADGLYYCEVLSEAPTGDGLVRVRTCPELGDNTRGEPPRTGVVEARFVWPLLRGENVGRLLTSGLHTFVLVPHDPSDVRRHLTVEELARIGPRLFDFLEPIITRLAARSAYDLQLSPSAPFAIHGPFEHLRPDGAYVVSRYVAAGGRPATAPVCASFVPKLGRSTVPYFNNKVNFLRVGSAEEAWFVATFVSADTSQDLVARIAIATTISPRKLAALPIPRFSSSDPRHVQLATLGKAAVETQGWLDARAEIDALVRGLAREVVESRGLPS